VARYAHNAQRGLGVTEPQAVLLGLLLLRGAQTAGELRIGSERWYKFPDGTDGIEAVLAEIKSRGDDGGMALAMPLPRSPGLREQRWMHLLCGSDHAQSFSQPNGAAGRVDTAQAALGSGAEAQSRQQRLESLEAQVRQLQNQMAELRQALGLPLE
jgi:hypothetical protein